MTTDETKPRTVYYINIGSTGGSIRSADKVDMILRQCHGRLVCLAIRGGLSGNPSDGCAIGSLFLGKIQKI